MIIGTLIVLALGIFILAVILAPFVNVYYNAADSHIKSVRILDTSGKKVSFQITYDNGKTKVETTKMGDVRYNKLRVMCK